MKQFIDYFWYQEGFSYDPLEGQTLSTYHLIMFLLCIFSFILLWIIGKKINNKNKMLIAIAIILLVLESLRVINLLAISDVSFIGALSFHLCSIGVYLMIIAGLFRKKWLFEIVILHALIGAPLAIIIPLGILPWYNQFSFLPMQSFLTHTILLFVIIYAWKYKFFDVSYKRFYIPAISILLSAVVAYVMSNVNLKYQTGGPINFFWTRYKDPLFEKYISLPHPYYFLVILGLLYATGLLGFLILKNLEKMKLIRK